jgi:hypothetical protein
MRKKNKKILRRRIRTTVGRRRPRTNWRSSRPHYSVPPFSSFPYSTAPGSTATSGQNLVFDEPLVTPRGDGTFIVVPGKPRKELIEVGTLRAARMLGIGHTALRAARESKLGRHYLRWRFTSEKQRVLAWEVPSLVAYKEATRSIGK